MATEPEVKKVDEAVNIKNNEDKVKKFKEKLKVATDMLRFIDSNFRNRKQRKQFYNDLLHNGVINTEAIQFLLKRFMEEKNV